MQNEWYVRGSAKVFGPFSASDLRRLAVAGKLRPDTPIRKGTDGRWVAASRVKGLLDAPATAPSQQPSASEQRQTPQPARPTSPPAVVPSTAATPVQKLRVAQDPVSMPASKSEATVKPEQSAPVRAAPVEAAPVAPATKLPEAEPSESNAVEKSVESKSRKRIWLLAGAGTAVVAAAAAFVFLDPLQLMTGPQPAKTPSPDNVAANASEPEKKPAPVVPLTATEEAMSGSTEFSNPAAAAAAILGMRHGDTDNPLRSLKLAGQKIEVTRDARANVQLAMQLAKQGTSDEALDQALKQAAALTSTDLVSTFLQTIKGYKFIQCGKREKDQLVNPPEFTKWSENAGRTESDPKTQWYFHSLGPSEKQIKWNWDAAEASTIEAAFFDTIQACYDAAAEKRAARIIEARRARMALRQENPTTVGPSFDIFDQKVMDLIDKCVVYDKAWFLEASDHCDVEGNGDLSSVKFTTEDGKPYMMTIRSVPFVCSREMGAWLNAWRSSEPRAQVKLTCLIFARTGMTKAESRYPALVGVAEVYKAQVYLKNGKMTAEFVDSGDVSEITAASLKPAPPQAAVAESTGKKGNKSSGEDDSVPPLVKAARAKVLQERESIASAAMSQAPLAATPPETAKASAATKSAKSTAGRSRPPAEPRRADLLIGTWDIVSAESDGKSILGQFEGVERVITDGDMIDLQAGAKVRDITYWPDNVNKSTQLTGTVMEGLSDKNPRQGFRALYEVNGDTLKISMLREHGAYSARLNASPRDINDTWHGEQLTVWRRRPVATVDEKAAAELQSQLMARRDAQQPVVASDAAQEAGLLAQSLENMKQLAKAVLATELEKQFFPASTNVANNGGMKSSWRVAILPSIKGGQAIYKQYRFDEPWNGPNNSKLIDQMPAVFRDPHDDLKSTDTSYFMVSGKGFFGGDGVTRTTSKMLADGSAKTLMLVEAKRKVPWTMPEDIEVAPDLSKPLPEFGGHYVDVFLAALADGTPKLISQKIEPRALRALFTIQGRELTGKLLEQPIIGQAKEEVVQSSAPEPTEEAAPPSVAVPKVEQPPAPVAPSPPAKQRSEAELRKEDEEGLQGTWDIVSAESNGKSILEEYAGIERVISSSYVIESRAGVELRRINFFTYPEQKPKWISMSPRDPTKPMRAFNGIYELDGDTLKISLIEEKNLAQRKPGARTRPEDLVDTSQDAVLTVWQRRPPPPKPEVLAAKFHSELEARRKDYQPVVATDAAQEAILREQSLDNLKKLSAALAKYNTVKKIFPAATMMANDRVTKVSWRVAILPFLDGGEEIYKRYHFDEAWDGPNNSQLIDQMPVVFRDPHDDVRSTDTSYFMPTGKGIFGGSDGQGATMRKLTDGTTKTLMLVEAKREIPWTKPEDIEIDGDATKPLPQFGGHYPGLFLATLADGTPKLVSDKIEASNLRGILTFAGGEHVGDPWHQPIVGQVSKDAAPAASSETKADGAQATAPQANANGSNAPVIDPAAAKEAAMRDQSVNNLKQLSLAIQNYHAAKKTYPASAQLANNQTANWRVQILPYVDHVDLYRQYNFNEPWDSPNNLKLVDQMPAVFRDPHDDAKSTEPSYFMIAGKGTIGGDDGKAVRLKSITDGTSATLMLVEAKRNVPWTKPEDIEIDSDTTKPLPQFGGRYPGLFLAVFADGAVRPVSDKIEPSKLRGLMTIAGGEVQSGLLQQRIVGEPKAEGMQPANGKGQ